MSAGHTTIKTLLTGAGEMAKLLRGHLALIEDPSLVAIIHTGLLTTW